MQTARLVRFGLTVAGLLTIGSAWAQGPGGGPPGPFGGPPRPFGSPGGHGAGAMLATIPEVQTELKLTDAQRTKLASLRQHAQQQMQQVFQQVREKAQNASPEEQPQIFDQVRKTMDSLRTQQEKQVTSILTPDQQKRLKQI